MVGGTYEEREVKGEFSLFPQRHVFEGIHRSPRQTGHDGRGQPWEAQKRSDGGRRDGRSNALTTPGGVRDVAMHLSGTPRLAGVHADLGRSMERRPFMVRNCPPGRSMPPKGLPLRKNPTIRRRHRGRRPSGSKAWPDFHIPHITDASCRATVRRAFAGAVPFARVLS